MGWRVGHGAKRHDRRPAIKSKNRNHNLIKFTLLEDNMKHQLSALFIALILASSFVSAYHYTDYGDYSNNYGSAKKYESYERTYDFARSESRTESHDSSSTNNYNSCYYCYGGNYGNSYSSRDSYSYSSTERSTETIRVDTYHRYDDGLSYRRYSNYYPRDPHNYNFYDRFGNFRRYY